MKQVLVAVGTRSETVKLAPVIRTLRDDYPRLMSTRWVHTGLHPDQVWQTAALFGLSPDHEFALRERPENLVEHSWELTNAITKELDYSRPDLMVVQGESLSSMLASQQAFMRRIPVVYLANPMQHLMASHEPRKESYRRLVSAVSTFQCVIDEHDATRLRAEGIPAIEIGVTGDTVVDALEIVMRHGVLSTHNPSIDNDVSLDRARILVALDAKDKWSGHLTDLAMAIAALAHDHGGLEFTVVLYPNASVRGLVHSILESNPNVTMREPMPYQEFVRLLQRHDVVITDAHDLQDETITLQKPTLVIKDAGLQLESAPTPGVRFVDWDQDSLTTAVRELLVDPSGYREAVPLDNPLGDGHAAKRVARLIANWSRNQILTPRAFEPFRTAADVRGLPSNLHTV